VSVLYTISSKQTAVLFWLKSYMFKPAPGPHSARILPVVDVPTAQESHSEDEFRHLSFN
jgi:hypothetical protein